MEHYLYLSSQDSLYIHQNNKSADFTIDLPKTLHLKGDWELALINVQCNISRKAPFYVLCNVVDQSYVRNTQLPILEHLYPAKIGPQQLSIASPSYHRIACPSIQHLRIYIKDSQLQPASFLSETFMCTLRLRQHGIYT